MLGFDKAVSNVDEHRRCHLLLLLVENKMLSDCVD